MCGFCTPGFVMADASALLEKTPNPTRSRRGKALDGNICRCGTYNRVLEAALSYGGATCVDRFDERQQPAPPATLAAQPPAAAAPAAQPPAAAAGAAAQAPAGPPRNWPPWPTRPARQGDQAPRRTRQSRRPRQVHLRHHPSRDALRRDRSARRIRARACVVDRSLRREGAAGRQGGRSRSRIRRIRRAQHQRTRVKRSPPSPPTTEEIARDAIRLIKVDYEVLPHARDHRAGAEPECAAGVSRTATSRRPRCARKRRRRAGAQGRRARRRRRPTRRRCRRTRRLETHGGICRMGRRQADRMWSRRRAINASRDGIADALEDPAANVRVITEYMGGGFGSKLGADVQGVICARLAKRGQARR